MWVKQVGRYFWSWRGIWLTGPSFAVLILLLRLAGALQLLEWAALDRFFQLRPQEPVDSRIALITVSEEDIKEYGWPLTDTLLTKTLVKIREAKPRAIGIDLYRDRPVVEGHQKLVQFFETTPNIIGITKVIPNPNGSSIGPPPALQKRGQVGASDLIVDSDGKIRRGLLSLKDPQGKTVLTFGTQLALLYLKADGVNPQVVDAETSRLRIGKAEFTPMKIYDGGYAEFDAGGYQILGNFRNNVGGFPKYSMHQLLSGQVAPELLRDRIVILGTTAESLGDFFYTSYSYNLVSRSAGMEVHANLASQIISAALDGRSLFHFWSEPLEWVWILLWALIGARLGWSIKAPRWTIIHVLIASSILLGSAYWLFLEGVWIPFVPPLLAMLGATVTNKAYILWDNLNESYRSLEEYSKTLEQKVEERTIELKYKNELLEQEVCDRKQAQVALLEEKEKSEELLLNILPQAIADQLKHEQGLIANRFESVTVLFSDIVDFTGLAARLSPTELVSILNDIFSHFDYLVERHGLEKIKTIGDAYMVVGGLPEPCSNHAIAIAEMALEMREVIQQYQTDKNEPFRLRIGINTGPVVAGVLGVKKFSYDLWGDTVNVASRMEAHGEPGKIQVTEATYQLLKSSYEFEQRESLMVKGIGEMTTYFLLGQKAKVF